MAHNPPENHDVDPQTLQDIQGMWQNFTTLTKVSTVIVLIVLSGMALFLL